MSQKLSKDRRGSMWAGQMLYDGRESVRSLTRTVRKSPEFRKTWEMRARCWGAPCPYRDANPMERLSKYYVRTS